MEPLKPRVFLSYSSKDSGLILRLEQDLRRAQIEPWCDAFEVLTGDLLREKIFRQGIRACDLFVAYLTPHSVASHWCREELDAAFVHAFEERGVSVALFVDSDATRETLRADIRARRCPVLSEMRYDPAVLELNTLAWLSVQRNARLVRRHGTIEANVGPFVAGSSYHWKHILNRVQEECLVVGGNLRTWLTDKSMALGLVDLLTSERAPSLTLIQGTPEILRSLGGEGAEHLVESVKDLLKMREALPVEARPRFHCLFHFSAATLSAVFCDPLRDDGLVTFTPRWGLDYVPQRRLNCVVERRDNPEVFAALFDSLLIMRQPNVPGLDQMAARMGLTKPL